MEEWRRQVCDVDDDLRRRGGREAEDLRNLEVVVSMGEFEV